MQEIFTATVRRHDRGDTTENNVDTINSEGKGKLELKKVINSESEFGAFKQWCWWWCK